MTDVRYAFRQLVKNPGFTAVAVLTLALGIGANTAMFTLVNNILLKPLAVRAPGELVSVFSRDTSRPDDYRAFSYLNYRDLRDRNEVFTDVLGQMPTVIGIKEGDTTRRTMGMLVTANYFSTLGVTPALGRAFLPEEETQAVPVVIVSHDFWRKHGSDPGLVGRTLKINSLLCTVVGVTPPGFTGTMALVAPEVLLPLGLSDQLANTFMNGGRNGLEDRSRGAMMPVARLKSGVTMEEATARLQVLSDQLAKAYPKENAHQQFSVAPLPRMAITDRPQRGSQFSVLGGLLLAMSCVVLLIACLNLANMMLARGASRRKEIAVRLALGAQRHRIFRQLITEALLLSLLGGLLGLFLATWSTRGLQGSLQGLAPVLIVFSSPFEPVVLVATLGFCGLATVFFAVGPAWRLTGLDVNSDLKDQGTGESFRGRFWTPRNLLAIGQVALSLTLLVAAGLFTRSAINALRSDPGFNVDRGFILHSDAQMAGYDEARGRQVFLTLLDRVRSLPGVGTASLAATVPFGDVQLGQSVQRGGAPAEPASKDATVAQGKAFSSGFNVISEGYFESLGVGLVRGREFVRAEVASTNGPRVAIINTDLAQKLWPGEDPLGRQIQFTAAVGEGSEGGSVGIRGDAPAKTGETLEVVGVVPTLKTDLFDRGDQYRVYVPLGQNYQSSQHLHVTPAPGVASATLLAAVRAELQKVDAQLPILALHSLRTHFERNGPLWMVRVGAALFSVFAAIALMLSVIGVYGLKAYAVARRTREIGIRMALGAGQTDVLGMVLREGLQLTAAGLGLGLVLALGLASVLSSFLFEVPRFDPVVFAVAPLILALASVLACWLPARRASRVDPMVALRTQ
ncbi:MAG: ABC transporter permease [Verrucomicrobia bacterium]|nr:ABC transporter permease [Verrucomicrobiota bacterium]